MFDSEFHQDGYHRLRTCAAYIHLTGCWPSHTRKTTDAWLRIRTLRDRRRGGSSSIVVAENAIHQLALGSHPMVVRVKKRLAEGYRLAEYHDLDACPETSHPRRRASGQIYMMKGDRRIIVKDDGSELEGWTSPTQRRGR